MEELIPIDTEYKGNYFRSRLEARYAVYLDALGWNWKYEFDAYPVKDGAYLPDFWFPEIKCFGEVKPDTMSKEELDKCIQLSERMNTELNHIDFILFEGNLDWKSYRTISNGKLYDNVIPAKFNRRYYPFFFGDTFLRKLLPEEWMAVRKGRYSRFEFEWKEIAPNG